VTFLPGQALPRHRASSPVVLEALEGAGVLQVDGLGPRAMIAGTSVQVEANVPHDVLAGPVGLRLRVRSVAPCCESC
jgi:quercetin dioxygenase-like cupin family protein